MFEASDMFLVLFFICQFLHTIEKGRTYSERPSTKSVSIQFCFAAPPLILPMDKTSPPNRIILENRLSIAYNHVKSAGLAALAKCTLTQILLIIC